MKIQNKNRKKWRTKTIPTSKSQWLSKRTKSSQRLRLINLKRNWIFQNQRKKKNRLTQNNRVSSISLRIFKEKD